MLEVPFLSHGAKHHDPSEVRTRYAERNNSAKPNQHGEAGVVPRSHGAKHHDPSEARTRYAERNNSAEPNQHSEAGLVPKSHGTK